MRRIIATLTLAALAACAPQDAPPDDAADPMPQAPTLGPTDGGDLPPTDLERVQVGAVAPDFTLTSLAGPAVTLSDFRGDANIILVFYRGHW